MPLLFLQKKSVWLQPFLGLGYYTTTLPNAEIENFDSINLETTTSRKQRQIDILISVILQHNNFIFNKH